MALAESVKFPSKNKADFFSTVKQRVNQYFVDKGISKNANGAMLTKSFILIPAVLGMYMAIILGFLSPWFMLGGAAFIGAGITLIGFNIGHDAIHGAYSSNKYINQILSSSFDCMGASAYLWKLDHNVIHHTFTNIPGHDGDIEGVPFTRLHPNVKLRKYHRFQHIYVFFLYAFTSLSWVFFKDYNKFTSGHSGKYKNLKHSPARLVELIALKGIYLFLTLALPIMVLNVPIWMVVVGFLTLHLFEGFTLAIVFQLAHVMENCKFPEPDLTGSMENNWAIHQMMTTTNFARKNKVLNWLFGGLNFQVEHHLFPHVCHIHYPKISDIVKQVAEEFQVPYCEVKTFSGAIMSHIRMLRKLGTQQVVTYS